MIHASFFQSESLIVYWFERMSEEASPLIFLLTLTLGILFIAHMKNFLHGVNMDNETAVQSWILWSSDFHYENLNYEVFPSYFGYLPSVGEFFCVKDSESLTFVFLIFPFLLRSNNLFKG